LGEQQGTAPGLGVTVGRGIQAGDDQAVRLDQHQVGLVAGEHFIPRQHDGAQGRMIDLG